MRKATVLGIVVLTASLVSLDFSEGAGDFFQILDQTTAEYLMSDSALTLHRSSSAAAVTGPRNNKYLEASLQIIRGKAMHFVFLFVRILCHEDSTNTVQNRICYAIPRIVEASLASTVDLSTKLERKTQTG